jgi:pimeloyl-ACP methyl ester carboxylesterase
MDDGIGDPIGLKVIYEPEISPPIDVIFVHGIGGTSIASWSKGKSLDKFWPKRWLPAEPGIRTARILSFGYNSTFGEAGPTPLTDIPNYASDLLQSMRCTPEGQFDDLALGQRPIIFIVHSVGGLVVKQAYLLAQSEEDYRDIVSSISAIMFLAAPNRGSDMTEILERILTVSISRDAIEACRSSGEIWDGSELAKGLNEQFKHFAPTIEVLSYYEKLQTPNGRTSLVSEISSAWSIALITQMVLEQRSSSLVTHADLTPIPLEADHNNVCKFDSPQDSNYVHVRNGLRLLMQKVRSKGKASRQRLEIQLTRFRPPIPQLKEPNYT